MGINARQCEQLLAMLTAQQGFAGGGSQGRPPPRLDEIEQAYRALGVNSDDSDKDIKKAYRRLMSQHHPDKLIGQGVPVDMMKIATEKAQTIQVAFDLIKTVRKQR
jgi:DnaJ like chaperone protein